MEQQQAEQSQIVAEQEKAIKQVLNTQAGLAEEYVSIKLSYNMTMSERNWIELNKLKRAKKRGLYRQLACKEILLRFVNLCVCRF